MMLKRSRWLLLLSLATLFACSLLTSLDDLGTDAGTDGPGVGTIGHPCYPNGTCNSGLTCVSDVCVDLGADTSTDSPSDVGSDARDSNDANTTDAADAAHGDSSDASSDVSSDASIDAASPCGVCTSGYTCCTNIANSKYSHCCTLASCAGSCL